MPRARYVGANQLLVIGALLSQTRSETRACNAHGDAFAPLLSRLGRRCADRDERAARSAAPFGVDATLDMSLTTNADTTVFRQSNLDPPFELLSATYPQWWDEMVATRKRHRALLKRAGLRMRNRHAAAALDAWFDLVETRVWLRGFLGKNI